MSVDALRKLASGEASLADQGRSPARSGSAMEQFARWQAALDEAFSGVEIADVESSDSSAPSEGESSALNALENFAVLNTVNTGIPGQSTVGALAQWAAHLRTYGALTAETPASLTRSDIQPEDMKATVPIVPSNVAEQARQAANKVSEKTGIPADLVFAQWAHETGGFTNRGATQLNNLAGIRNPGSAEYRQFTSVDDFADYYTRLISSKRYGEVALARSPEAFAASLKRGGYYEASTADYARGLRRWETAYGQS